MKMRLRAASIILAASSLILTLVMPAAASAASCWCSVTSTSPFYVGCQQQSYVLIESAVFLNPEDLDSATSCENTCGAVDSNSQFRYVDTAPPGRPYTAQGFGSHVGRTISCVQPPPWECTCKVVPNGKSCTTDTQTSKNSGLTVQQMAQPDSSITFGSDSFECKSACEDSGDVFCSLLWTPKALPDTVAPAPTAPVPAPTGQGTTLNNQILSGSPLSLPLPLGDISLPEVIAKVIRQVLSIVGALALAFFVWGGIQIMLGSGGLSGSGADAKKINQGKKTIIAALSGLVAIFASYAILKLILDAISK